MEFIRFERASSKTGCIQLEVLLKIASKNKDTFISITTHYRDNSLNRVTLWLYFRMKKGK